MVCLLVSQVSRASKANNGTFGTDKHWNLLFKKIMLATPIILNEFLLKSSPCPLRRAIG